MTTPGRLAPATRDEWSAPFFDALGNGALLLRRCRRGHLSAPEVWFCAECGSPDLAWTRARGTGHVVTWTAIHTRPDETGATSVSVLAGIVELEEGPWLRSRLLAADPATVRSGAAATLAIVHTEGEPVYAFRVEEA
ncbi:MAG TPA: OB-fold domain-containing protein [Streptosporangiaceae bacterium]|jgi:hypothetical protein|nr:OB-fold domain-containing protein [Streptosporangiaceae bacterium]